MAVSCYAHMSISMVTISSCNRLVMRSLVGVSPWACDYGTANPKQYAKLVAVARQLTSTMPVLGFAQWWLSHYLVHWLSVELSFNEPDAY